MQLPQHITCIFGVDVAIVASVLNVAIVGVIVMNLPATIIQTPFAAASPTLLHNHYKGDYKSINNHNSCPNNKSVQLQ